ncbi:unnamed protein product [Caenorhabditis brenneri]
MATNRFPLFRLPHLALCMVLGLFSPHQIIKLSFCSKRSLQTAKKCWNKKRSVKALLKADEVSSICLVFAETYHIIHVADIQELRKKRTKKIRIGDKVVRCIHKKTDTFTFWKDKIHGIGQLIDYIKELFDVPIYGIDLEEEEHPNEFIDTMDCIMSRQESVHICLLRGDGCFIDDCLTHLLDSCKITGELEIHGRLSAGFRHDWNISLDGLHVSDGSCITLQNLMNMDCKSLKLYRSSLTSEDINQFLKDWQNGGHSRIRCANIQMFRSMNHNIITQGIQTVPQPLGLSRSYPFLRDEKMMINGGLDLQRNDGKTGTICLHDGFFEFGVDPIEVLDGSVERLIGDFDNIL